MVTWIILLLSYLQHHSTYWATVSQATCTRQTVDGLVQTGEIMNARACVCVCVCVCVHSVCVYCTLASHFAPSFTPNSPDSSLCSFDSFACSYSLILYFLCLLLLLSSMFLLLLPLHAPSILLFAPPTLLAPVLLFSLPTSSFACSSYSLFCWFFLILFSLFHDCTGTQTNIAAWVRCCTISAMSDRSHAW